ncbi:helix-turn-helix domain-containing protein (plasmid) [Haladaptatus sp. SPP-AMP-3]|uniref:helix-turn-helix domain-containing protein n=1 Tax=Haladaptatus sp. SPP-AMP-3 TaxID=3121295 RepID=UPI003C2CB23D
MPTVQLRIDGAAVDDWLADLSTDFPESEFRLLATQPREDDALALLEARTEDGERFVRRFEAAEEVLSSETVYQDDRLVLVQFTTVVTDLYDALRGSDNVSRYPTVLRDGWFSVTVTAPHERLSNYVSELATSDIPYHVTSLEQSHESDTLLTERQWHIVTEAVGRGYYDSPRSCSLTELAEILGIHKSAASRLLHRAEGRVMKQFAGRGSATSP